MEEDKKSDKHQSIIDFYNKFPQFKSNEEVSQDRLQNESFPQLKNDTLLKLFNKQEIDHLPIWIMRQAGRYLPEFKQVRLENSFFEVCENPQLACLVTLQPILRFSKLDVSIIFSDILVIPRAMGLDVVMEEKKGIIYDKIGPVFKTFLQTPEDLQLLREPLENELDFVYNALFFTRKELDGRVPLIGFAGAPWTLFTYMCEGGSTKMFNLVKKWIFKYPNESHQVLQKLTNILQIYLDKQIQSGAQAIQIFDSFAGEIGGKYYEQFSYQYIQQICQYLKQKHPNVMLIVFAKGQHSYLEKIFQDKNVDCVGIDYTMDRQIVKDLALKYDKIIQGNMDPGVLLGDESFIKQEVKQMIDEFWGTRHIVNLGHGMWPTHSPDSVQIFTEFCNQYSSEKFKQQKQ